MSVMRTKDEYANPDNPDASHLVVLVGEYVEEWWAFEDDGQRNLWSRGFMHGKEKASADSVMTYNVPESIDYLPDGSEEWHRNDAQSEVAERWEEIQSNDEE